ncbi:MAG: msrA [Rickettsiaceae bacterium]|jgi:peptide-methionine (S)-S-oxide reductase|nr:msrA [Rickettsiaceae bacterium]
MNFATFGAGCFWSVELEFSRLKGVIETSAGFMGGHVPFPTYTQVYEGNTGHTEVVQITYDETIISYEDLLEVFWSIHDPTSLNRQGQDIGPQYKSAIFYHSAHQHRLALKACNRLDALKVWNDPIITTIEPASEFYKAEEYHQKYLLKRGIRRVGF